MTGCQKSTVIRALFTLLIFLIIAASFLMPARREITALAAVSSGSSGAAAAIESLKDRPHTWLLKLRDPSVEPSLPGTAVMERQELPGMLVVKPQRGEQEASWLKRLRDMPDVEYVQPSGKVTVLASAVPNDPERPKQTYLEQIRAVQAWKIVNGASAVTIALVDTGVDLNHPDLKGNLVPGTNLIHPGHSPQDDNGHGTNVAGVLAAVGNNGIGTTGTLWKARIMPIKALDETGNGDENQLGAGIMYAVKHGAKIVVLSVGLYRSSPYMKDIVAYAESQGVLLVAASGNDALTYGTKAAVKYPAAYPTVLAVGGVKPDSKPEPRSNPGSEIDVTAAWNVYTTAVGGGYKAEEGTSMAAPQAAAVAAMIWTRNPGLKPYQIRDLLRQTAKDVGKTGWDAATGYGLIQADKAVLTKWKDDAFEPDESKTQAAFFPLQTRISGSLTGGKDRDWYMIDAPYDGTLSLQFQGLISSGDPMPPLRITHHESNAAKESLDVKIGNKTVDWAVRKGKNYIELQLDNRTLDTILPYLLTADFQIGRDSYETNDKVYEAFTLAPRSQSVTGTFHQTGDKDWFGVTFTRGGTLNLQVETDSVRIDPAIDLQRTGEQLALIDDNGDGAAERSSAITVTPGKYYFRVYNAAADEASPVAATYKLTVDWLTKYDDPNEPNNAPYASTFLRPGAGYSGVVGKEGDTDWFQLRLAEKSYVTFKLWDIPADRAMRIEVFDKKQRALFTLKPEKRASLAVGGRMADPGTYYIKVISDKPFNHQYYRFKAESDPLVAGYRDIGGPWAAGMQWTARFPRVMPDRAATVRSLPRWFTRQ
jgi:hypothetical protein